MSRAHRRLLGWIALGCCLWSPWLLVERAYAAKQTPRQATKKVKYFKISRKVVQGWLQNPMAYATAARLLPVYRKGKSAGIKLVWVRKKSLYTSLGLRTGDIILSVNGKKLSAGNALGLYSKLPSAKLLRVELLRSGVTWVHICSLASKGKVYLPKSRPRPRTRVRVRSRPQREQPIPGSVQQLLESQPLPGHRKPPARRRAVPTPRPSSPLISRARARELLKQIHAAKSGAYLVPKALVRFYTSKLNVLASQAMIVPYFLRGKCVGFSMRRIKEGSIYQRIGLVSGDVVTHVNGHEFTSPRKALAAYSSFMKAKDLRVDFLRKGQPRKIMIVFVKVAAKKPSSAPPPARRR